MYRILNGLGWQRVVLSESSRFKMKLILQDYFTVINKTVLIDCQTTMYFFNDLITSCMLCCTGVRCVQIKTESDNNITDCSHAGEPNTGMF